MKWKKNNKKFFLVIFLLLISLGYAILTANLVINGSSKIASSKWDIHFANLVVNEDSVDLSTGDSAAVINPNDNTEVTYNISLKEPGQFYEFTVDAVNEGTVDGMIDTIVSTYKIGNNEAVTITDNNLPSYLTYSATYADDTPLLQYQELKAGTSEKYKVRVEFKKDIDVSDLPDSNQSIVFSYTVNYKQADSNAIPVGVFQEEVPVTDTIYWALKYSDNDSDYKKLIISDSSITGDNIKSGSFAGNSVFSSATDVPWYDEDDEYSSHPTNYNVEEVIIEETVAPISTAYWFYQTGYKANTSFKADLRNLNVSNVTNMSYMFYASGESATTFNLDLRSWNTSKVTDMSDMFNRAGRSAARWSVGNLGRWDTSKVINMKRMFASAGRSATTWSVGSIGRWDTSKVINMECMFEGAGLDSLMLDLNLSGWNVSNVEDMSGMFGYFGNSVTTWSVGDLSRWNISKVEDISSMFEGAGYEATTWSVGDLRGWKPLSVTDMSDMFSRAGYNATTFTLDLSDWNTSNVEDMSSMFNETGYNATTFNLNLSGWKTSSVTNIMYMFYEAGYNATTWSIGDLSDWDTSKVTDMEGMFREAGYYATSFALDLSSWNTSKVENMSWMFSYAGKNATSFSLDLSSWNTSNVTSIGYMFTDTGSSATTWIVKIPSTNGGGINNTEDSMCGSYNSAYPPNGREFTLVA